MSSQGSKEQQPQAWRAVSRCHLSLQAPVSNLLRAMALSKTSAEQHEALWLTSKLAAPKQVPRPCFHGPDRRAYQGSRIPVVHMHCT